MNVLRLRRRPFGAGEPRYLSSHMSFDRLAIRACWRPTTPTRPPASCRQLLAFGRRKLADLTGSERVRRHPHRRARSASQCGVSRGPRACRVRVPIGKCHSAADVTGIRLSISATDWNSVSYSWRCCASHRTTRAFRGASGDTPSRPSDAGCRRRRSLQRF